MAFEALGGQISFSAQVRNTFLDIEDPPDPAGEIVRSKTAPPGSGGAWAEDLFVRGFKAASL